MAAGSMLLVPAASSSLLRTCPRVVGLAGGLSRSASALASAAPEHLWLKLLEEMLAFITVALLAHQHTQCTAILLDGCLELLLPFFALPFGQGVVQLLRGEGLPRVLLLLVLIYFI